MSRTYEVHIEVRHHPRHLDDFEAVERTGFKLVDTGDPTRMVSDALRQFADEIEKRGCRQNW